jgi:hypothetical protein
MSFEGNEMSALRKRRVKEEDLLLLSMEDNLDEFTRAQKLLHKSNPVQVNAALANLPALAKLDPKQFDILIMQPLVKEITLPKDEETLCNVALAIDALLNENLLF